MLNCNNNNNKNLSWEKNWGSKNKVYNLAKPTDTVTEENLNPLIPESVQETFSSKV